jgi:Golgi phosphoprotein 3 (GPP34)
MLNLPEELLLLNYYEEKPLLLRAPLSLSLVGAVLAELLIQKRIKRTGPNLRRKDSLLTGDPILDEALTVMAGSEESHTAKYWVDRLHLLLRRLQPRLAEQLASKGVLTRTEATRSIFVPGLSPL